MILPSTLNYANLDFSAFLRQRRRDLDLTRSELARRVGCSPDTIKKLEEGERRPSKELAELLADHLQIDSSTRPSFIMLARARGMVGEAGPTNLPAPLTSFVGREKAKVEQISSHLQRGEVRLLTLLGPPGVGKSRLSLYAADQLRSIYPDGVWFVPLAAIEDPQQVLPQIAKTMEIADEGKGSTLDLLSAALRSRHLLLILDNFEQVIDAAPYITALLSACAQITAIVTSRKPLEVYGENRLVVQPLPVPPASTWNLPAILDGYDAIQLLVARIRAHNPTFRLTAENSAAVAELCVRLDGIPLALELAAGLTRAESPRLLLADVDRDGRLALLTTSQRDRTARQQTLREAIAWSTRRLSHADQLLFARLSVFIGPFDGAAAYAVAGVADDETTPLPLDEFSNRLQGLAASHLLQLQASTESPRYHLLETLREYAGEMLATFGATTAAQRRHADYFASLAFSIDPSRSVATLHVWRDSMRPNYPDLIAALTFAFAGKDVDLTLKLASGLGQYWYLEGSWKEGANWLAQALTLPGGAPAIRARAITELGILYVCLGRYSEAEAHLNEARAEATRSGDLLTVAWTLSQLGHAALLQNQGAVVRAYTLERLQIYRQLGEARDLALTLEQIGCSAVEEGDYERGIPWLEECQTLWDGQGSRAGVAAVRLIIGMAELAQGDAASALARFQKAYEEFSSVQHSHGIPWSLRNLGLAQLALGQVTQAQFSLLHAYERYTALFINESTTAVVVEAIAGIAARTGQHRLAAHLMGAASTSRLQGHLPLTENSRQIYERLLAPAIKALGQADWDQEVAVGATLPWAEIVISARALLTPHAPLHSRNPAPN